MPSIITRGAISAQSFGFGAKSAAANYIEDVFSTYLYVGTGAAQTITNGVNLDGNGGLVWFKDRTAADRGNVFYDTETTGALRGLKFLTSSGTSSGTISSLAGYTTSTGSSGSGIGFTTSGFSLKDDSAWSVNNYYTNHNYVSWSFRKQAKFFDIVSYTGTGSNTTIAHNLGSTPGCIIVKRTDTTSDWQVYHSGLTSTAYSIQLNLTNGQASAPTIWNSTAPTSSVFSVGTDASVNASGGTYVAYIYASNAGGFGAAGTDNVITCGAYTGTGAVNNIVNLGYEPQWLIVKPTNAYDWRMFDVMRGLSLTDSLYLQANSSNAENDPGTAIFFPTATGFNVNTTGFFNSSGISYIYIAIRRGPMKTPTDAATVFQPVVRTGTSAVVTVSTTVTPDFYLCKDLADAYGVNFFDRLRGASATSTPMLNTPSSGAETTPANTVNAFQNISVILGTNGNNNYSGYSFGNFFFSRAPSFFDEVCYTGNSVSGRSLNHNLAAVPELMIVKNRTSAVTWFVYSSSTGNTNYLSLNQTLASTAASAAWNNTSPTSAQFTVGNGTGFNFSGDNYVAYLFATCPGVSKVGSYSGTGATQTINCGFTGGARFVLIKRTDSAGDWYMFDSANGFTSSSSPYILLSSTAAQTTGNNGCYAASTGFTTTSTANATVNVNGAAYIFLAIA